MSQSSPALLSPEYGDSLMTVAQFAARYPHLYKNTHRVRWLVRDRTTNGLTQFGAVVEVFNAGDRPAIYIHVPSWFAWMQAGGSQGSRQRSQRAAIGGAP
ncbi:MAG: hypothetical protein ABL989_01875 [Gammaproteobacteria bacterium]